MTQMENASAKSSFIVNVVTIGNFQNIPIRLLNWHQIPEYTFQVSQSGIAFHVNNFFFEIVDNIIHRLIPSGILEMKVQRCLSFIPKIVFRKRWAVLTIDRLSFGFNIWLGFCALSAIVFVCEILCWNIWRKVKKWRENQKPCEMKFAKIHPKSCAGQVSIQNVPKNQKIFHIKTVIKATVVKEVDDIAVIIET
jgi:hypothetical protein